MADPHKIPIDPNGNLTSKTEGSDVWTYTWNAENQLTKVEKNGGEVARFAYDPLGRRVEKVASGVTTAYVYDGPAVVREVRGSTVLRYVHTRGIDEPLAVDDGAALLYFNADGLGSIVKTTSAAGAVTLTRAYDAWGNLEVGASEPGYAFTGREWDPETGLYYYRARYYDPGNGRFASQDPIGFDGGVNFYSYVLNNPTNFTDPSRLYGTNDCSYYKLRCAQSGGKYYCETAQYWCEKFPKNPDPDPTRKDDFEGWARCTRQCLQDCDQEQYRQSCPHRRPDPSTNAFTDPKPTACHFRCYLKCGAQKGRHPLTP